MSCQLLVEGSDDFNIIKNLLRERDVAVKESDIERCGGYSKLVQLLPKYLDLSSYDAIGIVIDADIDVAARWESIRGWLHKRGYEIPPLPNSKGTIVPDRVPRLGVWLMPNNEATGSIEGLVGKLIPDGDELWPLAVDAVERIPTPLRRFTVNATSKAEVHTWLAWQDEPGTPLGLAITKRYFDANATAADAFVDWYQRLRDAQ